MSKIHQASEIQELAQRIHSQESKDREQAYYRLLSLEAQNVDCSLALGPVLTYREINSKEDRSIRIRRFSGVFAERYLETNPAMMDTNNQILLGEYERHDQQLKGIIVRQAGRIVNDKNIDKLMPIIIKSFSSEDPYVRKSAALAVLSVHMARPSYLEKYKLGEQLKRLVEDSNPVVAANAVSALSEINASRETPLFRATPTTVNNLLASIDQTSEWAQIQILDFASTVRPDNPNDARGIISRVQSRLSHANAGVSLAAIKCCLHMSSFIDDQSKAKEYLQKIVLPLVTLLNSTAPIQYTAVKSLLSLRQNFKRMLSTEVSIFFCKFDDPTYMKLSKLDIILTLTSANNVGKVLEELYDYAQQADVEFVRKSIASIGKLAITFDAAAGSCVDKIVALVETKLPYVVQECIVVAVDIFRKYPNQYLSIIGPICSAITGQLDDHRAKAALAWILGEYCDKIGNAPDLIETFFLDDFLSDTPDVQLSVLTAVVKYSLFDAENGQDLLQSIISLASQLENPDVRDRVYQYYYLLTEAQDVAYKVIRPDQPELIKTELYTFDPEKVQKLIPQIGTLAILYQKLPEEFVETTRIISMSLDGASDIDSMPLPVVASQPNGLEVRAALVQIGSESFIVLRLTNFSENPDEIKNIAFDKNLFGFTHGGELPFPKTLPFKQSITCKVPLVFSPDQTQGARLDNPSLIQVAIQTNIPLFFHVSLKLETIFVSGEEGGKLNAQEFKALWQSLPPQSEIIAQVPGAKLDQLALAKSKLAQSRIYFCAKQNNQAFFTCQTRQGEKAVVFAIFQGAGNVSVGVRMNNPTIAPIIHHLTMELFK